MDDARLKLDGKYKFIFLAHRRCKQFDVPIKLSRFSKSSTKTLQTRNGIYKKINSAVFTNNQQRYKAQNIKKIYIKKIRKKKIDRKHFRLIRSTNW